MRTCVFLDSQEKKCVKLRMATPPVTNRVELREDASWPLIMGAPKIVAATFYHGIPRPGIK